LVYPYTVSSYNNSSYGTWFVIIFLLLLTAGFIFEFGKGALKINSKQTGYLEPSNIEVNLSKNKLNLYKNPETILKNSLALMLLLKEDVLDMFQFFLNNIHESVLFLISLFLVIAVSLIMVGIVCLGLAYFFEYLLPIGAVLIFWFSLKNWVSNIVTFYFIKIPVSATRRLDNKKT